MRTFLRTPMRIFRDETSTCQSHEAGATFLSEELNSESFSLIACTTSCILLIPKAFQEYKLRLQFRFRSRNRSSRLEPEDYEAYVNQLKRPTFRWRLDQPATPPMWIVEPPKKRLVAPEIEPAGPLILRPFRMTLLGSLPTEIRLKIYEYALGCSDQRIHVQARNKKQTFGETEQQPLLSELQWSRIIDEGLKGIRCRHPVTTFDGSRGCDLWDPVWHETVAVGFPFACYHMWVQRSSSWNPMLMLAFRYMESIGIFYSSCAFVFERCHDIPVFSERAPKTLLRHIGSLAIRENVAHMPNESWLALQSGLRQLTGVRKLRVYMMCWHMRVARLIELAVKTQLDLLHRLVPQDLEIFQQQGYKFRLGQEGNVLELVEESSPLSVRSCEGCGYCRGDIGRIEYLWGPTPL